MLLSKKIKLYKKHLVVIVGLILSISAVYSNSLQSSFQFDDMQFVDRRPNLHLTTLSLESIKKTLSWDPTKPNSLIRPIACLSLGLNYYVGRLDPTGYHIVNIVIHISCSIAVYYFIYLLLGIASIKPIWFQQHRYQLAALTSFLFALHPLQTNVATYIIQRMTSLSALFYIISICGFFIFRNSITPSKIKTHFISFIGLCTMLLFGAAAVLSKENSAMLPVVIIGIDYLFFFPSMNTQQKKRTCYIYIFLFITPVLLALFLRPESFTKFINLNELIESYSLMQRDFTLWERLLTEPRIVLFYIFLIFIPRIDLLNLNHDFPISHSLTSPPQTLFSIIFILLLITISFKYRRQYNIISFCIFWYFTNLIIESTIFPLELIFEHRTYLPGVTVFLLVAAGLYYISVKYLNKKMAIIFLASILILFGNATYMRNFIWQTPATLWWDIVKKSPNLARAQATFGNHLMEIGHFEESKKALEKSLILKPNQPEAMHSLSKLLILNMNEPDKGIAIAQKTFETTPTNFISCMALGNAYLFTEDYQAAETYFLKAIQLSSFFVPAYNNLGICLFYNGKMEEAIQIFNKSIALDPGFESGAMNLARVYDKQNNKKMALQVLSDFLKINPNAKKAAALYQYYTTPSTSKSETELIPTTTLSAETNIKNDIL